MSETAPEELVERLFCLAFAMPFGIWSFDPLELYRGIVPALLEQTSNAAYEEAIELVEKMAGALRARQREGEMVHYPCHRACVQSSRSAAAEVFSAAVC